MLHSRCQLMLYDFSPERWNDLPEAVTALPGLYNHMLTFSAGPRVSVPHLFILIYSTDRAYAGVHRHADVYD